MKHDRRNSKPQGGFTIVELMIASLVFTVILVVITSGVTHFTAGYFKGVHTSATQTTARTIMNTIAQELEYGGGKGGFTPPTTDHLCIGSTQINYSLGSQLGADPVPYGVFVSTKTASDPCASYSTGLVGKELLAPKMRLTHLHVTQRTVINPTSGSTSLYKVDVGVAFGDLDLLCDNSITPQTSAGGCASSAPSFINYGAAAAAWQDLASKPSCKAGAGSQFCAYSHLVTEVAGRF